MMKSAVNRILKKSSRECDAVIAGAGPRVFGEVSHLSIIDFKTCLLENGYRSIPYFAYLSVGERTVTSPFEPSVLHVTLREFTNDTQKTIRHCKASYVFYQGFLVEIIKMYQYNKWIFGSLHNNIAFIYKKMLKTRSIEGKM